MHNFRIWLKLLGQIQICKFMSKFSAQKTYAFFSSPINKKIIGELAEIGAETILFPTIEPESFSTDTTTTILSNLNEFSWLVFPDIYTVEFFLQKLEEFAIDFFELDNLQVCAVGESVADRLRFSQLHADIITNSIKTSDVFQNLKEYLADASDFEKNKFLILKEQTAQIELSQKLVDLNANVTELAIYQIKKIEEVRITKLKALLKGGAIDEFIFTSPIDVLNLADIFSTEHLSELLAEIIIFADDKATLQSLKEFGLISL